MELNKFIERFAEQFEDTNPNEIIGGTKFRELDEWSSLTSMGVIAMVKTSYNKTLTGADLRSCITIEDVFNLIKNKE